MKSTVRRRRLAPDARRAELLAAGERVVRRLGRQAKIDDVTAAAGAARATFYVYFESWEAFLAALERQAYEGLAKRFERVLAAQPDWVELIGCLPALVVDLTLSLEGLHAAAFHVEPDSSDAPRPTALMDRLAELLERGAREGALCCTDPGATAPLVYALLRGAADRVEQGALREPTITACRQLLLQGLKVERRPL